MSLVTEAHETYLENKSRLFARPFMSTFYRSRTEEGRRLEMEIEQMKNKVWEKRLRDRDTQLLDDQRLGINVFRVADHSGL
jgi:hypothetical protein